MDAEAEPPGMGLRRAVKIEWLSLPTCRRECSKNDLALAWTSSYRPILPLKRYFNFQWAVGVAAAGKNFIVVDESEWIGGVGNVTV